MLVQLALIATTVGAKHPHIVHIVADDLGFNDLGITNGGRTHTPTIDGLIRDGVKLQDYYTFRVCAPSRAATMTGRYPWRVGFYDMSNDEHHCVHPSVKMLPQVLKEGAGYKTAATGKWDVGYVEQHCTPTFRGFDTFLGYYTACTSDYWYHGAPGGNMTMSKCGGVDFHDSVTNQVRGAAMSGPRSYNNTYYQVLFTQRAVDVIDGHTSKSSGAADGGAPAPLYLYVAYHNVHDACQSNRFAAGLQAPAETVALYGTTKLDTWKVQAAMTTELDYGVGNITAALRRNGMWDDTLLIFMSDNGGPLDHSSNWPLRAGKGSEFEGGYRVTAFVAGGANVLPAAVRGTNYTGMMHSADWLSTLASADGAAGFTPAPDSAIVQSDSLNLWPAITGRNLTSPRVEVIHAVTNRYFNASLGNVGVQAARFGKWKLIIGTDCDAQTQHQQWPAPGNASVPFGKTGGTIEAGTDHARAPLLGHVRTNGERGTAPDPTCAHGIHQGGVCCASACGTCGGPTCGHLPGGSHACCVGQIKADNLKCAEAPAPCVMPSAPKVNKVCLYNLETDMAENNNLAGDPAHSDLVQQLVAKLKARADTGPDIAIAFADVGPVNKTADNATCAQQESTGYLEPIDWQQP